IPLGWQQSHIFPIPKPDKFEYDMSNTRPIALLDTTRKLITKVLTNRISIALAKNNILKGNNFCGLKNEETLTPLTTLQNIIEDARAHNKELWAITQDMKKAYDSISLDSLKLAFERI